MNVSNRMRRGLRAWKTKLLLGFAIAICLSIYTLFFVLPAEVERRRNVVLAAAPRAASEKAVALHQELRIADLHADSLLWDRDLLTRSERGHVDVPRLIEGNVWLQAFTIVSKVPFGLNVESNDSATTDQITALSIAQAWPPRTWRSLKERALYQAAKLHDTAARSAGKLVLIKTKHDLLAYLARREREPEITAAFLGVEGTHVLEGDLANIDMLFERGVRMMAPTHFFDNEAGGSAHGSRKGGLTEFGKEMIKKMEAKGMILDLAHASPKLIDDALTLVTKPVVVSHTGVRGTCNNNRNLSDNQLKGIVATGGVISIGFWEAAVCGQDAEAIARAMRYTADLVGVEHVGLGSDFDGAVTVPFDASGLVQLTDALLAAGFSEGEVQMIMGENVLRILLTTLPQ